MSWSDAIARRLGEVATAMVAVTATAEAASPASAAKPSPSESYALKLNTIGDCDSLSRSLNSLADATPLLRSAFRSGVRRDEFETSTAHLARKSKLLQQVLGGTDLILVRERINGWQLRYDADKASMEALLLFVGRSTDPDSDFNAHLELPPTYVDRGSFVGSNAQGGRRTVTKGTVYNLTVSFKDSYLGQHHGSTWHLPVGPTAAKAMKLSGEIVLLGRAVAPYFGVGGTLIKPTFDDPIDGMVLDHEVFVEPLCVFLTSGGRVAYRFIDRSFGAPSEKSRVVD